MSKKITVFMLFICTLILAACGDTTVKAEKADDVTQKQEIDIDESIIENDLSDENIFSNSSLQTEYDELVNGVNWDFAQGSVFMGTDENYDGNVYLLCEDGNNRKYAIVQVSNPDAIRMVVELKGERVPVLRVAGFEDNVESFTVPGFIVTVNFSEAKNLKHVVWDDKFTTIPDNAFYGCLWVTSVGPIGSGASVEIPDTVETIGFCAFMWCENLEEVTLPNGLKRIKSSAFGECEKLQMPTIPDSVYEIGDNAFPGQENIYRFDISSSLAYMGCLENFIEKNPDIYLTWDVSDSLSELTWNSVGWLDAGKLHNKKISEIKIPTSVCKIDERLLGNILPWNESVITYDGQTYTQKDFFEYFKTLPGHELIDAEADVYEPGDFFDKYGYIYLFSALCDVIELSQDEANKSGEIFTGIYPNGTGHRIQYANGRWNVEITDDYGNKVYAKGYFDENYLAHLEE